MRIGLCRCEVLGRQDGLGPACWGPSSPLFASDSGPDGDTLDRCLNDTSNGSTAARRIGEAAATSDMTAA